MGCHCNNIWFIKRYDGYKKRQAQEAKIKVNAYCLASIKVLGLVYVKRKEKRDRIIVVITMVLFVSGDRIQKSFGLNEINKDESFSSAFSFRIIQI